MVILGINAYHGDASAALVVEGALCASNPAHGSGRPISAIQICYDMEQNLRFLELTEAT